MKTAIRIALAAAALVALPAAADMGACASDPAATGLRARVESMSEKMDRIRASADPAEQRRLMALHAKLMQEGLQELRKRNASLACRVEMTDAMMYQMLLHQQFAQADGGS